MVEEQKDKPNSNRNIYPSPNKGPLRDPGKSLFKSKSSTSHIFGLRYVVRVVFVVVVIMTGLWLLTR